MKFFQELVIAIFMPRKPVKTVRFNLSQAQQSRVVRQCQEINSMIQEVHENLSSIRQAGTTTIQLTKETHANNIKGRNTLRQQQKECERINSELKKISEDMRAVRENIKASSQKAFLTANRMKQLEDKVVTVTQTSSSRGGDQDAAADPGNRMPPPANVVTFPNYKR